MHVAQVTCFDISFSVTRLAQHNVAPNRAAFQALKRLVRYLAPHRHTHIFYPKLKLTMYQKIRFEYQPGMFDEQVISNLLQLYVDSDHARDQKTRKSISCILAAICGVLVHWVMAKQTCVTAHSTDAEIRAFHQGCKICRYLHVACDFFKVPLPAPTVIWEDNQAACDIMGAGAL